MNNILDKINDSKHIQIVADTGHLALGSALYTLVLTMHKKVSFVCGSREIDNRFLFLPWIDKIKSVKTASADLTLNVDFSVKDLFFLLKEKNIKINQKMATAMYCAVLCESDFFAKSDGMFFAVAGELVELKADYKKCHTHMKAKTLSFLRLKALMLKEMLLKDDAKCATFYIAEDDLLSSGASLVECYDVMKESFDLMYVQKAVLLDKDNSCKILKEINKE